MIWTLLVHWNVWKYSDLILERQADTLGTWVWFPSVPPQRGYSGICLSDECLSMAWLSLRVWFSSSIDYILDYTQMHYIYIFFPFVVLLTSSTSQCYNIKLEFVLYFLFAWYVFYCFGSVFLLHYLQMFLKFLDIVFLFFRQLYQDLAIIIMFHTPHTNTRWFSCPPYSFPINDLSSNTI